MTAQQRNESTLVSGFLRLPQVLAIYPVSKSTWWAGVRDGRFPKPVRLSRRCTAWRVSDIVDLIERKTVMCHSGCCCHE